MTAPFQFFSNPTSPSITMVASEAEVNTMALRIAALVKDIVGRLPIGDSFPALEYRIRKLTEMQPLVEFLFGVSEARVLTHSTLLLRDQTERVEVARVLATFREWTQDAVRDRAAHPTWKLQSGEEEAYAGLFSQQWDDMNSLLLDESRYVTLVPS